MTRMHTIRIFGKKLRSEKELFTSDGVDLGCISIPERQMGAKISVLFQPRHV